MTIPEVTSPLAFSLSGDIVLFTWHALLATRLSTMGGATTSAGIMLKAIRIAEQSGQDTGKPVGSWTADAEVFYI